ncbi:hypothetical protein BCR43DRAFT_533124 [Syncephalastrum racemosum]|uniref:C2H2-type domain-containing protein n=1 Tax=Syncephalastrum racemosum TaxID=13706 RepID=A0A1X2HRG9_SYNRA|nr:hypothetical protein BCR43DRAFT_533124 [Syncephalastrum racemosum]
MVHTCVTTTFVSVIPSCPSEWCVPLLTPHLFLRRLSGKRRLVSPCSVMTYPCSVCGARFQTSQGLERHYDKTHKDSQLSTVLAEGQNKRRRLNDERGNKNVGSTNGASNMTSTAQPSVSSSSILPKQRYEYDYTGAAEEVSVEDRYQQYELVKNNKGCKVTLTVYPNLH